MSRAFVKEADIEAIVLPDRPLSPHRNLVTEAGLRVSPKVPTYRFAALSVSLRRPKCIAAPP